MWITIVFWGCLLARRGLSLLKRKYQRHTN
uniref:DnaJ homolog subfamily C member 17 n=1 Tax=Rhizophora mucronata TaxID=61149 RepID=A0A2P2NLG8_RHIMU